MSSSQTVDGVLCELLESLGSSHSRRAYRSDWNAFASWLEMRDGALLKHDGALLKVRPLDMQRYVSYLADAGKAQRTRSRALSVIREVYRALVANELLAINPVREIKNTKRGRTGKKVTWLEEEQLAQFLAFGSTRGASWRHRRDRMCIQLLAGTGRRRSEVARMRVEDFADDGVTGVVKGGAERTAPVPEWLREELRSWLEFTEIKSGFVLPRAPKNSVSIGAEGVYRAVKRVACYVGIPPAKISPHGIRRTLATLSERRNVPLADIQAQLNHASRSTTEGYLKGSRQVAEAPGEWMSKLVKPKSER